MRVGPKKSKSGKKSEALLEKYRALAAQLEESIAAARKKGRNPASLASTLTRTYDKIGRLTGEGEITEDMVLRSPAFQRVLAISHRILEKYPAAAKALAEEFERLEAAKRKVE